MRFWESYAFKKTLSMFLWGVGFVVFVGLYSFLNWVEW